MNINSVQAIRGYESAPGPGNDENNPIMAGAEAFAKTLEAADKSVADFSVGRLDAQGVVEALSEAELALQTVATVRDRIVVSYQELLRMPL